MNPELSVVIGSLNAKDSVDECLTSLHNQCNSDDCEIIVADNSTDETPGIINKNFPDVKLLRSPASTFIPELWEAGINHARGRIVALTTAHCVPRNDWIKEILKAHEGPYAGIGGAIENSDTAGIVEWAIYFCRYVTYMLPFEAKTVGDIPADNASYKRWALDRYNYARRKGFWEPFIHAEILKDGHQLLMKPDIVVYHKKSFSVPGFIRNRFWHGRQFGSSRALKVSGIQRIAYILLSPLIPAVFLYRIIRQLYMKKRNLKKFTLALSLLSLFLLSWAAGELYGYLHASK